MRAEPIRQGESKADRPGWTTNPARPAWTPGPDEEAAVARASGEDPYDLAIIGSGGAGFSAAIAARRKDRRVVMVDRDRIGGTCVNSGCVPSKALLAAAQARQVATEAGQRFPGIATTAGPVDPVALLAGKQALVEQLQADKYIDLAAAYGWEVLGGHARFVADLTDGDGPALQVDVVATVRHHDGSTVELRAEGLLVAAGRRPVTDGLGLEAVGVKVGERGQVVVDERLRTHNPRIWAAGDVTGAPQFVYVAAAHGTLVADNALDGAGRTLDYRHLPRVTFTSPQLAAVGLTDAQVAQEGIACTCRVLPLTQVPRALVDRDTRGLVKLVAERTSGRVLGVTMVADGAGDAIQAAVYAVKLGMTVGELADTWAPYLTMGEGLKLAAQAFTRDITKLSCCAA